MGFIIEIMVFLIISSMIMLFVAPTNEVIQSRNNLARDVKQVIKDSDTQKAINSEVDPPEILEKAQADDEKIKGKLKDNAIIYNKLDQETSKKEYSYNDKRYNVIHTKKAYIGQELAKDSRWVGNISNFNYKVNNKIKIDRIVENYLKDVLTRNEKLDIDDISKEILPFKERDTEGSITEEKIKYNDKNKLVIIEDVIVKDDIEIWDIEYAEIKDIKEEHDRYVIKYDIIKGQIEVEKNKDKLDKENLEGIEYDIDFDKKTNNGVKKSRLILQRGKENVINSGS